MQRRGTDVGVLRQGWYHHAGLATSKWGWGSSSLEWGRVVDKLSDIVPTPAHRSRGTVARTAMARAHGLGLLLALLLPVVGTSLPGTVIRLNKAMLGYGKRHAARLCPGCLSEGMGMAPRVCVCVCVRDPKSPMRTWILSHALLCPWPPDKF